MAGHGAFTGGQTVGRGQLIMREIHRILFIRTDRIGDCLMNLGAIGLLRQSYPKAWLALCVDDSVADLFKGHPDLDEILTIKNEDLNQSRHARAAFIKKLKKIHFDMALISNPNKFFHWAVFSAGIPMRVGYKRKWSFLLTKSLPDNKDKHLMHELDANVRLVKLVSNERWDGAMKLPAEESASQSIHELIAPLAATGPLIAVHTGTSDPDKRWPIERFKECD